MYTHLTKGLFISIFFTLLFLNPSSITQVNGFTSFYDNFDRADNNTLGPNWSLFYGSQPAGIENNRAYIEVGAGGYWGFYKVNGLNIQNQDVKVTYVHQNGDTTLLARVIDVNNRIAINYYVNSGLQIYEVSNGNYRSISNTAPNAVVGETYTIRALIVDKSLKIWINGIQYVDTILNNVTSGSAGFGANDGYTRVYFDDFSVEDPSISNTPLPSATATPTTTPTATATATATATSTPTTTATAIPYINLDVPSLKQFTSPWGSQKYAHTNWTITNYGCALTSATMVLKYHGHNTNPEDLNKWLRNQSDGYLKGSLLNWLAVSRYSKLNDSFLSPTLEFNRFIFGDQVVKDSLNQGLPLISKVPGHFVVIKGMEDNEFTINDPGYNNRNNLSYYPDRDYLIKYTPTHSDLSYIMAVVQGNKTITLLDTANNEIAHSYIETPIKNLYSDNLSPSTPYSVLYFQKPETGKYKLKINGQGQYNLDLYYYYKDGDFKKNNLIGNLKKNQTNNYEITYFKNGEIENLFNKLINQTKEIKLPILT